MSEDFLPINAHPEKKKLKVDFSSALKYTRVIMKAVSVHFVLFNYVIELYDMSNAKEIMFINLFLLYEV